MRDLKFCLRMCAAFGAIVLILGVAQKWDDAQTESVRVSMRNT
ncbi:hypothetical protein [Paraburkholderia tuberum]|uniref:Uncharacterized protein n=1 Tax=Paraburkholderia tuberum TaxID=157910 RepID=A0A1H1JBE7_9BURK|nr:hypothetical protein [Paraburkholderia tuberum]SDR47307.1 hypothetical protein SAMN05445850_4534 [Paraburkholderia tuberum]